MTQKDRTEVRDMIHDILSGWEAKTESREEIINLNLIDIKDHLKKLNGTVASHTRIIADNLPHTIVHCPQAEIIEKLNNNMVSEKAVKKTVIMGVTIICTLITIIWGIMEIFIK